MTINEFLSSEGLGGNLIKYDISTTYSLNLPKCSKEFLTQVGVSVNPRRSCGPISFVYPNLPKLSDVYLQSSVGTHERDLRVFAHFSLYENSQPLVYHCLENHSGSMYCFGMDFFREYSTTYCNSSINQFFEFLIILDNYEKWLFDYIENNVESNIDKNVIKSIANETFDKLQACDYQATSEAIEWINCEDDPSNPRYLDMDAKMTMTSVLVSLIKRGHWDTQPLF